MPRDSIRQFESVFGPKTDDMTPEPRKYICDGNGCEVIINVDDLTEYEGRWLCPECLKEEKGE